MGWEWEERNQGAALRAVSCKLLRREDHPRDEFTWHNGSRKNKSKSSERGRQAKSREFHGRKYQADGNKVGWEAESKSVQRDGIKAGECHRTKLLILDSLTASQEGASARHSCPGC